MSNQHDVLTFFYKDQYGDQHEYRTVDITGMDESQINAVKARMFGQMYDYLIKEGYDTTAISNSEPEDDTGVPMTDYSYLAKVEEELECLQSQNELLLQENEELRMKVHILKEMVREG